MVVIPPNVGIHVVIPPNVGIHVVIPPNVGIHGCHPAEGRDPWLSSRRRSGSIDDGTKSDPTACRDRIHELTSAACAMHAHNVD